MPNGGSGVVLIGSMLPEVGPGSKNACGPVFFFNRTATTEFYTAQYTLSLHDALPICGGRGQPLRASHGPVARQEHATPARAQQADRKSTRLNSSHIEPSRMPSSA